MNYEYNIWKQRLIYLQMRREHKNSPKKQMHHDTDELVPMLLQSLLADDIEQKYLVKLNEKASILQRNLIGQTHVIYGTAGVGKCGVLRWAIRDQPYICPVIIDCLYHKTESTFIEEMTSEMSAILNNREEVTRKIVMADQIRFSELNNPIKKSKKKFLFIIRHAHKLADMKKQLILYNLLEWIKTDIREHIGIAFLTRSVLFVEKLEKRVKSRLSAKVIYIGPPDEETVKSILCKRLAVLKKKSESKEWISTIRKIIDAISEGNQLQKLLNKEGQKVPKNIIFYLELFKLIFALAFSSLTTKKLNSLTTSQIEKMMAEHYEEATRALHPYIKKQQSFLRNANYPEYIVMAIIKSMMECEKNQITPKNINNEFKDLKKEYIVADGMGSSFNYAPAFINNALKKLEKLRLITIHHEGNGFDNSDITSNMSPEAIRQAIDAIPDLPEFIKKIMSQ